MMYDAIVVGAGPAGSVTARYAASGGAKILIVDKKRTVGKPIQCGEFLPTKEEICSILPDLYDPHELFDYDKELISKRINEINIVSPRGRTYHLDFHGYSIKRDEFDRHLVERAQSEGAELRLNTVVTGVKGNKVITNSEDLSAKVIVGADGPLSRVAGWTGLTPPRKLSPCIFCWSKGDFDSVLRMQFGSVAPGGYAWIIPKEGEANIGLGIQHNMTGLSLKELFSRFLKKIDMEPTKISTGFVPISGPVSKTVLENVLLVGDSAGHVMATNGGGVPIAMVCAREAGLSIADYISSDIPLSRYETRWRDIVEKPLNIAKGTKRLADTVFKNDFLLEWSMRVMGQKRMARAVRCQSILRN
jgi:digeranylgeranylglycerophospholipid reductase